MSHFGYILAAFHAKLFVRGVYTHCTHFTLSSSGKQGTARSHWLSVLLPVPGWLRHPDLQRGHDLCSVGHWDGSANNHIRGTLWRCYESSAQPWRQNIRFRLETHYLIIRLLILRTILLPWSEKCGAGVWSILKHSVFMCNLTLFLPLKLFNFCRSLVE